MNFLKTQLLCRLVLAVSACVLLLVACTDRPTGPSQAAVARQVADSTARAQTDTTALTILLHQYQKDSNRQGVMVTLYYLGRNEDVFGAISDFCATLRNTQNITL